nr:MAG TPA: hypothetical protein [Caudoviricetes sp.]
MRSTFYRYARDANCTSIENTNFFRLIIYRKLR